MRAKEERRVSDCQFLEMTGLDGRTGHLVLVARRALASVCAVAAVSIHPEHSAQDLLTRSSHPWCGWKDIDVIAALEEELGMCVPDDLSIPFLDPARYCSFLAWALAVAEFIESIPAYEARIREDFAARRKRTSSDAFVRDVNVAPTEAGIVCAVRTACAISLGLPVDVLEARERTVRLLPFVTSVGHSSRTYEEVFIGHLADTLGCELSRLRGLAVPGILEFTRFGEWVKAVSRNVMRCQGEHA